MTMLRSVQVLFFGGRLEERGAPTKTTAPRRMAVVDATSLQPSQRECTCEICRTEYIETSTILVTPPVERRDLGRNLGLSSGQGEPLGNLSSYSDTTNRDIP